MTPAPKAFTHPLCGSHRDPRPASLEKICALDLEGIVAKLKDSPYRATEQPSPYWIKIKNRNYTQAEGREELFDPAYRMARTDGRRCVS